MSVLFYNDTVVTQKNKIETLVQTLKKTT